jgi:hypothetical protein
VSLDTAVETLMRDDPEFGLLCEVLYGQQDVDMVLDDLTGVSKAQDPNQHNMVRRFGLAATVAGAGLGVGELAEGATHGHLGARAQRAATGTIGRAILRPINAATKTPKRKMALAGTMLAGDVAAGH